MKTTCVNWKDRLLEAALGEAAPAELENHLSQCGDCAAELALLRARRERLDALLPLMASAAEPSPDLGARILARTRRPGRAGAGAWALAGAAAIVIAGIFGWAFHRRSYVTAADLRGAQALAQWHAPTDVLLETPGWEFLRTIPRLGGSYMNLSPKREKDEGKIGGK